ncbi:MAG: glycosyltransferase family 2 protein [Fidelibacterota bacterium]|nr:MAG: glycosyltransferase family 2 protein [Candidatus Neomarinimicrobiota bacterium]
MMKEPKVVAIILNWNGRELVLRCLRSLMKLHYGNINLIVVDNGSEDDSVKAITEEFPEVQVVALAGNTGYARGNNAGLDVALEQDPEWIMFLNNDTEVDENLIAAFVDGAGHYPDGGIFGPKIYYGEETDRIWYAGGEVSFPLGRSQHRGIREHDRGQYDKPQRTDFVSGCCLFIKADLVRRLGGFDSSFPMYMEDVDLCYRAMQEGVGCYYLPDAKVWHYVSSSMGGELSLRKVWLKWWSGMRFFKRYAKPWHWCTIPGYQVYYFGVLGPARYVRDKWRKR